MPTISQKSQVIKVGFCVSYDWEMLKTSIPRIYSEADLICLAVDKDRHSWAGNPYHFDNDAFYKFVKEIDIDKKITIYEDDFSLADLNTRENCNRHRMLIAEKMGKGGWHLQIDSDEYFLNFQGFIKLIKSLNPTPTGEEKPINIACPFLPLIKKTKMGYLYVDYQNKIPEVIPIATNKPDYQRARQNGHFNHIIPFYVIHDTWARSDEELLYKINNWGHASEELIEQKKRQSYYNLWKALDEYNYQYLTDFHPAGSGVWPKLAFQRANNIDELIKSIQVPSFPLNAFQLWMKNNRNIARLVGMKKKLLKL
jgi:hypothetical protein